MKTRRYTLRLRGLAAADGEIPSETLEAVLASVRRVAERVARLRATGVASAEGPRPKWLERTVGFTVTGLGGGSTALHYRAPSLRDTAEAQFGPPLLWGDSTAPNLDDTALDLTAEAVRSMRARKPSAGATDRAVAEAVVALGRSAGDGVEYEMRPEDSGGGGFELDDSTRRSAEEQLERLPESRAWVVTGRIDRIQHDDATFRLRLRDGATLAGRLDSGVEVEELRPLWGREATIVGPVHFRPDGRPRVLVARQIGSREEGHAIFEQMPEGVVPGSPVISRELAKKAENFDWSRLEGLWEIEQSPEEVLAQIREMRSAG